MKKLLSALFILGSVTMLANEATTLPAEADPTFCLTNPCSSSEPMKVKVKVPQKLVIDVTEVDLGLWCGDKALDKDKPNQYEVTGEKGQKVNVEFKGNGYLGFRKGNELFPKFTGTIKTLDDQLILDATTGKAKGGVNVKIPKPGINLLEAGTTYTATATLMASYDTSAWDE
ncbi:MAG: hypothetical protein RR265_05160 [Cetobacterium sp.]|uniref:hypothetical protein n=1 Tax=Cetobacterium sp. TaxID=2071632 RepID=UPI002FC58CDE